MVEQQGKLQKLLIESLDSSDNYEVLFNPETYSEVLEMKYEDSQAAGTSATELKYLKSKPQEFNLRLIFDSTGVTRAAVGYDPGTVAEQIEKFKKVTVDYKGDKHRPNGVRLSWGTWFFEGYLTKMDITYEIFSSDATPLRAKAQTTFLGSVTEGDRAAEENNSSPDLTHIRIVTQGDTLPLMCYRIYGDSKYYLRVAEANALDNFRNLKPGTKLFFPPLAKTTS